MHPTTSPKPIRERRRFPRSLQQVRVLIMPEDFALEEPYSGWLVDSSHGGVRLAIRHEAIAAGTLVTIRRAIALSTAPWTTVRVKNVRPSGENWELGCELVPPPAAAVPTQRAG